jgi:hypothetical protein
MAEVIKQLLMHYFSITLYFMNKAAVEHQQDWLEITICIVHNKCH